MKFKFILVLLMVSTSAFGFGLVEGALDTAANVATDAAYTADAAVGGPYYYGEYPEYYGPAEEPYYGGGYPYAQVGPFVF
ncbi:hypothetical protein A3F66_00420 [candidate division TM6 bacterium RIFCSPHIGHO2_12_FULL_32_22]|nr:MAG: hypothetical protein A3F66_00420 [candidate division TM6 bacterium RIFCSPHIGHO2_12_FULL_32_22]